MEGNELPSGDEASNEDEIKSPAETPPSPEDKGGQDKVAYESYRKLLSEKKRIQKELEKVHKESEKRHKEELESQQKYKELWESQKSEAEELKQKLSTHESRWENALKLNAFNEALGDTRKIDSKYAGFVDTSKILIDPDTGKIDPLSAQKEVERVSKEYPEIVKSTVTSHLPNQQPAAKGGLTYEAWLKLPAKEMAARMKEVRDSRRG